MRGISCCSKNATLDQEIGGRDRRLPVIQFCEPDLTIGINERLLINPPDALERPHIEGILGATLVFFQRDDILMEVKLGRESVWKDELTLRRLKLYRELAGLEDPSLGDDGGDKFGRGHIEGWIVNGHI